MSATPAIHALRRLGIPFTEHPLIVLMHGDREVSLKSLARAIGAKTVAMCRPEVAERHTVSALHATPVDATDTSVAHWLLLGNEGTFMTIPTARYRRLLTLFLMVAASGMPALAQGPSATEAQQVHANVNQLMRGVLYPAANVVFFAQADDPGAVKPIPGNDPAMATDPLMSSYGGWQAIENAALALAESANLLLIPGRTCANGVPAPTREAEWSKFVREVRDAGMNAYKAAQTKDQDKMIETAEKLSTACAGCHLKWRNRRMPADRCK